MKCIDQGIVKQFFLPVVSQSVTDTGTQCFRLRGPGTTYTSQSLPVGRKHLEM